MANTSLVITRRHFVQGLLTALALVPFAGILASCTKEAGDQLPPGAKELSETDPVAQALGFVKDNTRVDTAKFPKKAGPDGASQLCGTCAQYTAANMGWGNCKIFPQGLVPTQGWCNTWSKKPS